MAPYLMTLAVGSFELTDSTVPGGAVRIDAVPPDTDEAVRATLDLFPQMVSFLQDRLGDYPFRAAGNVVVPGMPPTALETQTRSVLSLAALQEPDPDQLVLHELAHQWFGDSVTPATWADIWLNEGPAVYLQWTWAAANGGPSLEESARASHDPGDPELAVPPADPGPDDLFGASVYERSAIFLVELERLMGTEAFDELLRTWLERHAYAEAGTEEFVELAGEVHGESIRPLSDPWLYGDELPPLSF
jgi:aminopeptidase N